MVSSERLPRQVGDQIIVGLDATDIMVSYFTTAGGGDCEVKDQRKNSVNTLEDA